MRTPDKPKRGDDILAWAHKMVECVRSLEPRSGPGVRANRTTTGTIYSAEPGRGGGTPGLEGFWVYRNNTLLGHVPIATALAGWDPEEEDEDPDNWSLKFSVASSLTLVPFGETAPAGTYDTDLYDGNAAADPVEPQDFYSIPMRRNGRWICRGGVFRENRIVRGALGPSVELLRIG